MDVNTQRQRPEFISKWLSSPDSIYTETNHTMANPLFYTEICHIVAFHICYVSINRPKIYLYALKWISQPIINHYLVLPNPTYLQTIYIPR